MVGALPPSESLVPSRSEIRCGAVSAIERKASEEAAAKPGIELSYFPYTSRSFLPTRDLGELETAFRAIAHDGCNALVVFPDSAMYEICDHVARLALQAKLPSVSGWSSFANKGLMMTYGPNVRALYVPSPAT
jgi:hypothetical protein